MPIFDVRRALPLLLALACLPALAQHGHAVTHPGYAAPPTAHVPETRWVADANLREGMGRIRAAVDELRHREMGHMDKARALALADSIGGDVGWIVAHCELAPDADAALHPVIGALAANASALKSDPRDPAPIAAMRDAIDVYDRLFDDPGVAASAGAVAD